MLSRQYVALGIALVVIVAGLVGLASRGDEEQADTVALQTPGATSAAPTTSPPQGTEAPPPRQTTAPPQAPPAETEAPPAETEAPAAPGTPGETTKPRAGTYTYKETSDGETSESTLGIVDTGPGRQEEISEQEDIRNDILWRDDAKLVEKTTFGDPPNGFECDWEPDIRELVLPLREGASWEVSATCEVATDVTFEIEADTRVLGTAVVPVGGQDVATWRLESQGTVRFTSPQGSFEQEVASDDHFAPEHGLYVRSVEKTEGDDPQTGQPTSETTTRELVSLEPS